MTLAAGPDPDAPQPANVLRFPAQRPEELVFYRALRDAQRSLHPLDTLTICPQPWCVLRRMTLRPDFIVIMRSALAIQIDGSSHQGRAAADLSRDYCCEDHNLPVLRVPVEDVYVPELLEDWVLRVLQRVRRYRPLPSAA